MVTWVNSYKSLNQHFRLSIAMSTNQNEEFIQLLYAWWMTTQQTILKMFCQNTCTCSETAIKTYFHFSHYKSMETLSCHSNESTWATATKTIFVEANVMNISAKFQLHAAYGFWGEMILSYFSQIYPFGWHGNQSNSAAWTKFICLVEDYSRNISEKLLSKYLQWDRNKGLLSLVPL